MYRCWGYFKPKAQKKVEELSPMGIAIVLIMPIFPKIVGKDYNVPS